MKKVSNIPVSLLIPCKNEEVNLDRCIKSVDWADEIFVVDSQSSDKTPEIAQKHGAKVVQFKYQGGWPKKKNWALENLPFSNEWVLILDADECLPPESKHEIKIIVSNPNEKNATTNAKYICIKFKNWWPFFCFNWFYYYLDY